MAILFILLALIIMGHILGRSKDAILRIIGYTCMVIFIPCVMVHTGCLLAKELRYENFVEEGISLERSLKELREEGEGLEKSIVLKDIEEWNKRLKQDKERNKNRIVDQYIDDRIELLEPIR